MLSEDDEGTELGGEDLSDKSTATPIVRHRTLITRIELYTEKEEKGGSGREGGRN